MGWINSSQAFAIAAVPTVLAVAAVGVNTFRHLKHWHAPRLQRPIVRITMIVPLYVISSWFSLVFPGASPFIQTVRDCYEAFAVWCFLTLILEYCGGESGCLAKIEQQPPLKQPWPCCMFPRLLQDARYLRWCKRGVIQFVVVKPVMALVSLALLGVDKFDTPGWTATSLIVYNTSYTLALYALLLFYMSTRSFLRSFHPIAKFTSFKLVIFAPYWQSLAVAVAPGLSEEDAAAWNNFLLCCEFFVFSLIHFCAFSFAEFAGGAHPRNDQTTSVLSNMQTVLSMSDLISDTIHNFSSTHSSYVLQAPGDPLTALAAQQVPSPVRELPTGEDVEEGTGTALVTADHSPRMPAIVAFKDPALDPRLDTDSEGEEEGGDGTPHASYRDASGSGGLPVSSPAGSTGSAPLVYRVRARPGGSNASEDGMP